MTNEQILAVIAYQSAVMGWYAARCPDESPEMDAADTKMEQAFRPEIETLCAAGEKEKAKTLVFQIPSGMTRAKLWDLYEMTFGEVLD